MPLFVDLQVGRLENAIGWYHSHPGYGCWLSGIDVSTQMLNQQFQEPFVAVVVRRREKPNNFLAMCDIILVLMTGVALNAAAKRPLFPSQFILMKLETKV